MFLMGQNCAKEQKCSRLSPLWYILVLNDRVCLVCTYVALYGLIWPCMALYGLVWSFFDFHGHGHLWPHSTYPCVI